MELGFCVKRMASGNNSGDTMELKTVYIHKDNLIYEGYLTDFGITQSYIGFIGKTCSWFAPDSYIPIMFDEYYGARAFIFDSTWKRGW